MVDPFVEQIAQKLFEEVEANRRASNEGAEEMVERFQRIVNLALNQQVEFCAQIAESRGLPKPGQVLAWWAPDGTRLPATIYLEHSADKGFCAKVNDEGYYAESVTVAIGRLVIRNPSLLNVFLTCSLDDESANAVRKVLSLTDPA